MIQPFFSDLAVLGAFYVVLVALALAFFRGSR